MDETEHSGEPSTSMIWTRPEDHLPLRDRVSAYVRNHPGATKTEICDGVRGKKGAVLAAIADLEAIKRIRVEPHGKGHRVYPGIAA